MQVQDHGAMATAVAVERRASPNTIEAAARSRVPRVWVAVARLLRTWWKRELQRRELSMLSPRDFGDLTIPRSLVNEEIRRWPWQKSSQQWSQVTEKRGDPYDGGDRTSMTL